MIDRQMSGGFTPTLPTDELSDPWHSPYPDYPEAMPAAPAYPETESLGGYGDYGGYDGYGGYDTYAGGFGSIQDPAPGAQDQAYLGAYQSGEWDTTGYPAVDLHQTPAATGGYDDTGATAYTAWQGAEDAAGYAAGHHEGHYAYEVAEPRPEPEPELDHQEQEPEPGPEREPEAAPPPPPRRRRRAAGPRRSAFFSVAAPSLAVLGVTAIATAATVNESGSGGKGSEPAPVAAPDNAAGDDAEPVAANREFDTQLTGLSQAVDDYANRASQTQADIDLERQQEREEREAAEEAARQEALRPKFALPVEQHGLSAYFGDAGINWMSLHTGIDFPVSYGTPVMAATDGEITTQWDPSYGNMVILTAPDGTETWYAHLSSTVYTSGWVQAGTVIAYSGDSGNSTGPHLHFEVRPWGGDPVDPLYWLRDHGLEPT
ncbi:M23 family metallopeptidase [Streptomyces sp. 6N223]|uniref:M23 family metallopeptidase n=1 Tax=Streptomyces sp. 6N223 TaxID=3457412 RepID=UPI003FD1B1F3